MVNPQSDYNFLRPKTFKDYIGQTKIVQSLKLFIEASKKRGSPSEHLLFYGPPGIGKTTLAHVVANELGGEIKITSGAVVQKTGDLAAILTNLKDHDILFIDEIHRLPKPVEEILYPVLEEYALDIVIGKGPSARSVRLNVPKITIIGSTTKLALLSAPLRDRFGMVLRLDFYNHDEMTQLIQRSAKILKLPLENIIIDKVCKRSRKTPRIANRILKRIQDVFEVGKVKVINEKIVDSLFNLLEIDSMGLTNIDIKYLKLLGEKYAQTAVGVETISSSLAEDRQTVEEFVEPYLLQLGFIKKTPRGRVITLKALEHLKIKPNKDIDQESLLSI